MALITSIMKRLVTTLDHRRSEEKLKNILHVCVAVTVFLISSCMYILKQDSHNNYDVLKLLLSFSSLLDVVGYQLKVVGIQEHIQEGKLLLEDKEHQMGH